MDKNTLNEHKYLFGEGADTRAYEFLGAHFEGDRVVFRTWAPNAKAVSVVGDFNGWNPEANPMHRADEIWETEIDGLYRRYRPGTLSDLICPF